MNKHIDFTYKTAFGKPVIKGTRIAVELIIDLLSNGLSVSEILEQYPQLKQEDIFACLAYAKNLVQQQHSYKVS